MTGFAHQDLVLPRVISSLSRYGSWRELVSAGAAGLPSSAAWPTANLAIYIPFTIPFAYPVKRVFWCNGTVSAGHNLDFGIYDYDGTRLYHTGSTAQGASNTVQYTAVDFILPAGRYYKALAMDSTASQVMRQANATAQNLRIAGLLQQGTAFALPASATFATVTNAYLPICGISLDTTGF